MVHTDFVWFWYNKWTAKPPLKTTFLRAVRWRHTLFGLVASGTYIEFVLWLTKA